jgi:hypothetical protein
MKRLACIATVLFFCLIPPFPVAADEPVLLLKGLEIAKGIDIGDVRYGTKFTGEILDGDFFDIGYWYVTLNYIGAENVEVCGGENDIIQARMTIVVENGEYSGMVILSMRDRSGSPDVFWSYSDFLCGFGGLDCPYPWEEPIEDVENCLFDSDPEQYGPIGRVGGENGGVYLRKVFATGYFRQVGGATFTGWLRHNYPFIPRVDGTLELMQR